MHTVRSKISPSFVAIHFIRECCIKEPNGVSVEDPSSVSLEEANGVSVQLLRSLIEFLLRSLSVVFL